MKTSGIVLLVILLACIFIALSSFFIVDEREQVLVLRAGAADRVYNAPTDTESGAGLKFKIPVYESIVKYDRRNVGLDIPDIELLDANQEQLVVDAFVRYQINNPLEFYQKFQTRRGAENQLRQFTNTAIRNALAEKVRKDIISGQRGELMQRINDRLSASTEGWGVQIIDVRIRAADLPQDVLNNLYKQMTAAREKEAKFIRSNGQREAQEITAVADKDKTVILAEARKQAEILTGEGDALATGIYNGAYTKDAEFFRFQRALIACEKSIQRGTRIVVAPDSLGLCDEFIDRAKRNGR